MPSRQHEPTVDLDEDAIPRETKSNRERLRRTMPTIAMAAAVVAAAFLIDQPTPSAPSEAPPAAQPARLVAPAKATAGDHVVVLGHRNRRLCGPAELRFDGRPVSHKVLADAGRRDTGSLQLFLWLEVPRSATPGTHQIELYGPVRSTAGGAICGDTPERQARIDSTVISINAAT